MSFSISLSGHTENRDQVKRIFRDTVRQLRAVEGSSTVFGSISDNDGVVNATDVTDEEADVEETQPVEEETEEEDEEEPEEEE